MTWTLGAMSLLMAMAGAPDSGRVQDPKAAEEHDARMAPRSLVDPLRVAQQVSVPDVPQATCARTILPSDGSTSGNSRAPSVRYRGARAVYLITKAELTAAGLPTDQSPSGIGWHYSALPGVTPSPGALTIYLENTGDQSNTKSPNFAAAVAGMTIVHNAPTTLPNSTVPFDIPFVGGTPFTYTGGGLYVAFDWRYTGPLSATAAIMCNTAMPNGLESSQSTTGSPAPDPMASSGFRPETRLTVIIDDDVSVDYVMTMGALPSGLTAAQVVRAVVTNRGNARNDLPVTLNVTGAQSFTDTQTVSSLSSCGGQTVVTFAPFTPTVPGHDTITVSIPADDVANNNAKSELLDMNPNRASYKYGGTTPTGGVGVNGTTAELVAKFNLTAASQVDSVSVDFPNVIVGATYRLSIRADNGAGAPGPQLYLDAADRNVLTAGSFTFRLPSPVAVGPGDFYVGVVQTSNVNMGLGYDAEVPVRSGAFYLSAGGGTFTDFSPANNFKLNIGITVGSCLVPLVNDVRPPIASVCAGTPIVLTSNVTGGTGTPTYQWTENGTDIAGQTTSTTVAAHGAAGTFAYNCKVADDGGCVGVVDPADSTVTWIENGGACDDGVPCTTPDVCVGNACVGHSPCDDGDACTTDLCDGQGGCYPHTPVNCDDDNPCTDDSCNVATGCVHAANTNLCSDGNPCTIGDACSGGICTPGAGQLPPPARVCNSDGIAIPVVGAGTPYPSTVTVFGLYSYLCGVTVELNGVAHVYPDDIDVLLARASGSNAIVMSDVGGNIPASGVNLTLSDAASASLPDAGPLVSGTFKPTNIGGGDIFPPPAPTPSGGSALSAFTGNFPNGDWNLWVVDQASPDGGSIAGWCVNVVAVCTSADCDDGNPCTDDICDASTSACIHTANTLACDDGNPCSLNDHCGNGSCQPGTVTNCNDNDNCTTDACDGHGGCVHTAIDCDDANPCTDDACTVAGACVHSDNVNPCSDGNPCTIGDTCAGGVCASGTLPLPPAARVCGTGPISIPAAGAAAPYPSTLTVFGLYSYLCSLTVELNGFTHDAPSDLDVLLARASGPDAIVMSDVGGFTPVSGVNLTLTDAAPASLPDTGPLVSGTFKPTNIGAGDVFPAPAPTPSGGAVLSAFVGTPPNGDWNLWVADQTAPAAGGIAEWCVNVVAVCAPMDCDDGNPCTDDLCDPSTSNCVHTNRTGACDDGNACTVGDVCGNGACIPGAAAVCDDANVCTSDGCNPNLGCVFTNNPAACNDGNPCTDDSCSPTTGCAHLDNKLPCSDGNACTTGDTCGGGACQSGAPTVCNDNNACTDDSCAVATGCVFTPNNANACSDDTACTQTDTCVNGVCTGSNPVLCNDGNACTSDTCNPATGSCVFANNTASCDDGNPCSLGGVCGGGSCQPGPVGVPSEVTGVRLDGRVTTTVSWSALPGSDVYDVASGTLASLLTSGTTEATCQADDVSGQSSVDQQPSPPIGQGYYYLVRGQNPCGTGGYGFDSAGAPRTPTAACP